MRWHQSNSLPKIDKDKVLCIVEIKEEYVESSFYELMWWHSRGYFSKYSDQNGINALQEKYIIRWGYVEEDDSLMDEMVALTAIKAAADHVQELFDILLTDGFCCDKEYPSIVGLTDLRSLKKKLTDRILYLDDQIKI